MAITFTAAGIQLDSILELVPLCLPFFVVAFCILDRVVLMLLANPAIGAAVDAAVVAAMRAVCRVGKLLLALPVPID